MVRDERDKPGEDSPSDFSRRAFLKGASLTLASVGIAGPVAGVTAATQDGTEVPIVGPGKVMIDLQVNGKAVKLETEPWMTLLDAVRQSLDLTGSKRVCDRGFCGACTMVVGGKPVNSCTYLAIDAAGQDVRTVEGLLEGDKMTALQEAFVDCDALQCGFCTPGMVMACTSLLEHNPAPSEAEVRAALAGNLCRCGTYQNIFEAVEVAAKKGKGGRRAEF